MELTVRNLVKSYHQRPVLNVDDVTFGHCALEGLIGPNGAGKSTLMGLLTRRIPATSGTVECNTGGRTHDLMPMHAHEVAQFGLVKTNQRIQNFESLTIKDSLRLAATAPASESLLSVWKRDDNAEDQQEVENTIDHYLEKFSFVNPDGYAKSAGEKKLLDILRCLMVKPRMLLMDEPTAGLPEDVTHQVMEEISREVKENNLRVLIVEHDLELIWKYCEYVHFLSDGEMLCKGPPEEVKSNKFVAEKYLGI